MAVSISILLIATGTAFPLVIGSSSPGQMPDGVPFQVKSPGQAGGGFFYQTVANGVGSNLISVLAPSNGGSVQSTALSSSEGASLISPQGDVYYLREGEGFLFFSQPSWVIAPPTQSLLAQILEVWNDPTRKRSRFRIYVEILELLKEQPLNPFEVAFKLRLNAKRTRHYLDFLEERGVIDRVEGDSIKFSVNREGIAFLEYARRALMLDR